MGWTIYNVLLVLASPVIALALLSKSRCRRGFRQRLGRVPDRLRTFPQRTIWIHAVSLGEVLTVAPLVKTLRAYYPGVPFVVSTITETGREAVEGQLAGVAEHCYLPLDFRWAVEAYIRALRPLMFVCVETELWPNLFRRLNQEGVPTVLVNGRISSRSFRRYLWIRPFMREVLATVSLCLMQSDRDVQRIRQLGAPSNRVFRTGNMKFDQDAMERDGRASVTRSALGLNHAEGLIVAGSTHHGEEEALLRAYAAIVREFPATVLLLAPRHVERAAEVERHVRKHGYHPVRRSRIEKDLDARDNPSRRVIILDTRGELAAVYALARVAFVGGTLVPIGGHNLLEPARWGKPVLFGPHIDHCAETATLLLQAGGGVQVQNEEELAARLREAMGDPDWVERTGRAARAVVEANRGVVERTAQFIDELLASNHGLATKSGAPAFDSLGSLSPSPCEETPIESNSVRP